jgi:hypothetical protein
MCQAAGVLGLAIAAAVSAAAWVYLVAAHGEFWRTGKRLLQRQAQADHDLWPAVVAVLPARNEADAIPGTLPTLLAQDYPGNSASTWSMTEATTAQGPSRASSGRRPRGTGAALTFIANRPRPDGWAGKVWAMAQGMAAAITPAVSEAAKPIDTLTIASRPQYV